MTRVQFVYEFPIVWLLFQVSVEVPCPIILDKYSLGDSLSAGGLRVGIKEIQSSWQNRFVIWSEFSRLHIESVTELGGKPEPQATA